MVVMGPDHAPSSSSCDSEPIAKNTANSNAFLIETISGNEQHPAVEVIFFILLSGIWRWRQSVSDSTSHLSCCRTWKRFRGFQVGGAVVRIAP
jgi:hypothetical protein